ncbi:MAG: hypothetical protein RLZZ31_864 [Actinomycetota bacterium]|jgi:MFS family permease
METKNLRLLSIGLVAIVTLVAFESLAIATIMPTIEEDLGDLAWYGWVFSAFFFGSLIGIVLAGTASDRMRPVIPYLAGLVTFTIGIALGALAPSMPALVLARGLQGIGAGVMPAIGYVCIGRVVPLQQRPKMFALISSAWTIPGILGPVIAVFVADAFGWRAVFFGLLPFCVVFGAFALAGISQVPAPDEMKKGEPASLRIVAAPIAVMGLLNLAFFATDAFVPYTVVSVRDGSSLIGGLAMTSAAVLWTAASWLQSRLIHSRGPRYLIERGLFIIAVACVLMFTVLHDAVPLWFVIIWWGVAGFGMGLAYSPLSHVILEKAPAGQEGRFTTGMRVSDGLGVAIGTGLAGVAVNAEGVGLAYAISIVVALVAIIVASTSVAKRGGENEPSEIGLRA